MPETSLILHVKGTEAETAQLPAHVVRKAISQGQITHSQLIWSPADNSWKQVRELPHLLPQELLILHVKGTEAETKELGKEAVRNAISQGELSHSQLIWSPTHNSWRQAREFPDLLPGEHLILHIKGTEAGTTELPKRAVRAAISKGEITHSQLIWSPTDHAWKQVREMPQLLPSQKLAPAPERVPVAHAAVAAMVPDSPTSPVAQAALRASQGMPQVRVAREAVVGPPRVRVAVTETPAATPQVRVAADPVKAAAAALAKGSSATTVPVVQVKPTVAAAVPTVKAAATPAVAAAVPKVKVAAKPVVAAAVPKVKAAATPVVKATATPAVKVRAEGGTAESKEAKVASGNFVVKEAAEFHPLKWVCIGLSAIVLLVLGVNYFFVDEPLEAGMGETPYRNIPVFAHLGAFLQPNVMVVHIPGSPALTRDNLVDFMVKLSRSTPENPFTHNLFDRVAFTSGWMSHYSMSGLAWKQLGDSEDESAQQIKDDLLTQLSDSGGQPLMTASSGDADAQQAERDKVWSEFSTYFAPGP